jgi:hypothetical protein
VKKCIGFKMPSNGDDVQLLFCLDSRCAELLIDKLIDVYKTSLYRYNTLLKKYGVYLKPVHIIVKKTAYGTKVYHYYGKYWYRLVYSDGKLRWIYMGREKPSHDIPDPPINPLLVIKILPEKERDKVCVYIEKHCRSEEVLKYIEEAVTKLGCTKYG